MQHPLEPNCCAVILSGGQSTRMHGRNKAFLEVNGRTILDRLIYTLEPIFKEILLVTRQPELYADKAVRVVEDIFQARSSLTGIHAGLTHAQAHYAFVVPCDLPLLKPELIRLLIAEIEPCMDAVVPFVNGFYEPLCAIYAKSCLPPIKAQLALGDFKITRWFDRIQLKQVGAEKIKQVDPQLLSFQNVNTPEAYEALKDLLGQPAV